MKEEIKQNFIDIWLRNISECNKLEFYSDIKSEFEIEPYLNLVENKSHKHALAGLRTSAQGLYVETSHYKRCDKELKTFINAPREEKMAYLYG